MFMQNLYFFMIIKFMNIRRIDPRLRYILPFKYRNSYYIIDILYNFAYYIFTAFFAHILYDLAPLYIL